MWRSYAILAATMPALLSAAPPAFAFQEIPAAPPSSSEEAAPQAKPPVAHLATPPSAIDNAAEQGGIHVFGYDVLPKLDFGLELLYGQDQEQLDLQQGLYSFDGQSDVSVVGKVRRRF